METIISCIPQFYAFLRNTYVVDGINLMTLLSLTWGVALIFYVLLPYTDLYGFTEYELHCRRSLID